MMTTLSLPILRFESTACEKIHRQCSRESRDFHQVPCLLTNFAPQLHPLTVATDRINQSPDDRPPYTRPVGDLFDKLRRVLAHNIGRGTRFLALARQKDLPEVGVKGDIDARLP